MNIMFPIQQTFAKLSILLLYHRLFGIDEKFRTSIRIIGFFQLLYFVATVVTSILICQPVYKYWQPFLPSGRCINIAAFLTGVEIPNSLVDFAMVILAIFMLRELHIDLKTKLRISVVFAVGGA
jgi:hypothetical protein